MKPFLIFIFAITALSLSAQHVGINNLDPQTSMDIEGALRLRAVGLEVSANQITLPANTGNFYIGGAPTGDFTINESGQELNGQILVLTNQTAFRGFIYDYTIKPGQTMIFIRNDDGFIPVEGQAGWKLDGNYNTNPTFDFLGTNDPKDLIFKTSNQERMRLTSDGRLGIGTQNPLSKFELASPSSFELARFNGGNLMYLTFAENGINRGYLGSYAGNAEDVDFGTEDANITGKVHLTTANTPRLTVAADGRIGIGITSPTTTLDVSNTAASQIARFNGGNGMWITLAENGINRGYLGSFIQDPEDVEFGTYGSNTTGRVHLSTGNLSRLAVEPNGNIGIGVGILAAQTKLHVSDGQDAGLDGSDNGFIMTGTVQSTNLLIDDNEILARNGVAESDLSIQRDGGDLLLCGLDQGNVGIGVTSPPVSRLQIVDGDNASFSTNGYLVTGNLSGANIVMDNNELLARNNGGISDLFIQQEGGDLILCANEQGAVGIGVISGASIPAGSLLAVDGKITCEEVLVKLSENWPDYVFAKDYPLAPLSEVKSYIDEHQHLPGIPSAATIQDEGIELGEMQRRMMEKIEELTLYIIQLENEVKALKEKIR
jgi:hypothetical protein